MGEIYDESDEEDDSFVAHRDGSFEVSPEFSISDFLERTGLEDDAIETDHNSIGGWIMDLLDRMPEDGEQIYSPPFKMTIKMEDEQKIDRIRIEIEDQ